MKTITLQTLKDKGACADQVALFAKRFGEQAEVTGSACIAVAPLFNWDWAAQNMLSPAQRKACDAALAEAFAKAYTMED
jgi:hypothetical protein